MYCAGGHIYNVILCSQGAYGKNTSNLKVPVITYGPLMEQAENSRTYGRSRLICEEYMFLLQELERDKETFAIYKFAAEIVVLETLPKDVS